MFVYVCVYFFLCVRGVEGFFIRTGLKLKTEFTPFRDKMRLKEKIRWRSFIQYDSLQQTKKKLCFINLEVGRHYRSPPYIQLCLSIFGGETWGTAPIYGTFFKRTGHLGHTILALYPQREKKKEKVSSIIQRDSGQPHSNRRP